METTIQSIPASKAPEAEEMHSKEGLAGSGPAFTHKIALFEVGVFGRGEAGESSKLVIYAYRHLHVCVYASIKYENKIALYGTKLGGVSTNYLIY
jgi:hypothetical protein